MKLLRLTAAAVLTSCFAAAQPATSVQLRIGARNYLHSYKPEQFHRTKYLSRA